VVAYSEFSSTRPVEEYSSFPLARRESGEL
jgi:hypothetical protein